MPTYEYKCDACGEKFEKFQSIKADAIRKCPFCGKNKVQRLISTGAGLIFKGSGFYITDYRSESYKEAAKAESPGKPAEGGADKPATSPPAAESKTPAAAAEKPTTSKP